MKTQDHTDSAETLKPSALFITEQKYMDYAIPGGVQLCTAEFIQYFETAGYQVIPFKVKPVISTLKKIKIKLGIEVYSLYEIKDYAKDLVALIVREHIKVVLFNQLNLAHWVSSLKGAVPADVKFIGLSHGNESGDYLHEITTAKSASLVQTWRLGRLLVKEKYIFQQLLHGLITISKNDQAINQWLGAQQQLFLPRILSPDFIRWSPVGQVIGFVGTLDHLPNLQGISKVAEVLKRRGFQGQLRLVGHPASTGTALAKKYPFITYRGALSPENLLKEAESWSIFLNPVFWYSRGSSTKLAQGINWGLPVISTPAGTRGYALADDTLISADHTPEKFVDKVLRKLESAVALAELKQASENNAHRFKLAPWVAELQLFIKNIQQHEA